MGDQLVLMMRQLSTFLVQQRGVVDEGTWLGMLKSHKETCSNAITKIAGLTPAAATEVSAAISAGPWSVEQKAEDQLSSPTKGAARPQQGCAKFGAFLSRQDREVLRDPTKSEAQKLEQLATRCLKIGLVLPTESAKGGILCCGVAAGLVLETPQAFYEALGSFKKILKRRGQQMPRTIHLTMYPDSPELLPEDLKSSYAHDPAEPLTTDDMLSVKSIQTLRGNAKALVASKGSQASGSRAMVPATSSNPLSGLTTGGDPMTMLCSGLMNMFQSHFLAQNEGAAPNLHIFTPHKQQKQKALMPAIPSTSPAPAEANPARPGRHWPGGIVGPDAPHRSPCHGRGAFH